jgi:hypothetical protein
MARHFERTIERLVVHPLSNLIATEQISPCDWIQIDFDTEERVLTSEDSRGTRSLEVKNLK